jgi:NAD(P)-dependent dehydrogenase (short-subunit alcohol dehydrogenase family)
MQEIKNNFETNFFGPIAVMQAVLPQMRVQQSGLIINITSCGHTWVAAVSQYSASKGALELVTESLRMEVKSFGIAITNGTRRFCKILQQVVFTHLY